MSWSEALRRSVMAGLFLAVGTSLGACSFTPVYGGAVADQPSLQLAYAKPNSRLEQIVYQELSLRFGSSSSPTAPLATVSVGASGADMVVTTTTNPAKPVSIAVTATLTITARDGSDTEPKVIVRTATAEYTRAGQVLADAAAATEASERAARSVAESLRLALLAALNR